MSFTTPPTPGAVPRHVAIIMDGNGRWAKARGMPRTFGHREGVRALERVVRAAAERGVRYLTVFAFSSENWRRPKAEVTLLMELFRDALARWQAPLAEARVRMRVIGDRTAFSERLCGAIDACESATAGGSRMTLQIAANYGGQWDVCQAARAAAEAGLPITPENIERYLSTQDSGSVDLLIRTGGEQRISNFLIWQSAYAEIFVSARLWPDFDAGALDEALGWFAGRERRFGMTSEQVSGARVGDGS